jgi:hypothetical protein
VNELLFALGWRLGLDLMCVAILVVSVFRRKNRAWDFVFACIMLNVVTFTISFLLNQVPMDVGVGFGLFAIFGILRYRTEPLRMSDLTYLLIMIALALVHGLNHDSVTVQEIILLDVVLLLVPVSLETFAWRQGEQTMSLRYDRTDLLADERSEELHKDIHDRLGVDFESYRILRADLLRDTADLKLVVVKPEKK